MRSSIKENRVPLWRKEFVFLIIVSIINFIGLGMTLPLITGFAISLGASLSLAGLLFGLYPIFALIGTPFGSAIGDKYNKRNILIVALVLNGLAMTLYAFIPNIGLLVPLRIVHGIFFSVCGTISFAIGTEYIPEERMAEGIGFLGIGQIVGMAIGPNIGIFLVENFSYEICFLASGLFTILAGLALLALKYTPPLKEEKKEQQNLEKKKFKLSNMLAVELLPNVAFVGIFMLCGALITSFLVLFGAERGIPNIGLYFTIHAIIVVVTRPFIGRFVDKKGVSFAILPGFILASLAMFVIGSAYSMWMIVIAAILIAVGAGGGMPAIQADCVMRLGRARSAVASGTFMIGLDIGMTIGPIIGGVLADNYGFNTMFYAAGALLLVGFLLYMFYNKSSGKRAIAKSLAE